MKKRSTFIVILAILLALPLNVCNLSASNTDVNGIWYDFDASTLTASVTYKADNPLKNDGYSGKNVIVPAKVVYGGKTYSVTSIGNYAFAYSKLTSLTIPSGVTSIGGRAFYQSSSMTTIVIPETLNSIGEYAFCYCSALTSITCKALTPPNVMEEALCNLNTAIAFYIPKSSMGTYSTTYPWNQFTNYKALNEVITVASGNCGDNLTWTLNSDGLLDIKGSGDMTSFAEESAVPWDGYREFITSLNLPEGLTSISAHAFTGTKITSVSIPNAVTTIGDGTFSSCRNLTSVTIPNGVTSIGKNAFYGCSGLTSVTMGNSVTTIEYQAFYACSALKSVTIPASVTLMGADIYKNCTRLTSIVVESGNSVFDSRDNCNAIIITASNSLFVGCQNTIIPNGVTNIAMSAFWNCTGLTSVTIPSSVTSIDNQAFWNCIGLTSITCEAVTPPVLDPYAFSNVDKSIPLYVPKESLEAYKNASGWSEFTNRKTIINGKCGENLTWTLSSDGLLDIKGSGDMTSFAEESDVPWDEYRESITSLNLPDGITSISAHAFTGTKITSVSIPNAVTTIGDNAFYWCVEMTDLTIGSNVASIGSGAFDECYKLNKLIWNTTNDISCDFATWKEIVIGDGITSIPDKFFINQDQLESVIFGKDVESIGNNAFEGCSALPSVSLPDGLKSIGEYAFTGCTSFTSISLPEGLETLGAGAFDGCSSVTSINFPAGITELPQYVFAGIGITSLEIPNHITSIGSMAFAYCPELTTLTIGNDVSIRSDAFDSCTKLTKLYWNTTNNADCNFGTWKEIVIGDGVTSVPDNFCSNQNQLESVTFGKDVESIGKNAFDGCSALPAISLPEGLKGIGEYAFTGCTSFTSISLPEGLENLGAGAFDGCSSVTSINFPAGITELPQYVFAGIGITSLEIPNHITSIGSYAFADCTELATITVGNDVSIHSDAFDSCTKLTKLYWNTTNSADCNFGTWKEIVIGDGITSVPDNFCSNQNQLESVTFGKDVESIGKNAFEGCSALPSVSLPEGLKGIGEYAFTGCTSFTSISLPEGLESLGEGAFDGCSSVTSINFPAGITELASSVFAGIGITSLEIPNHITSISDYAFAYCNSLTSITSNAVTPPTLGSDVFEGVNTYIPLYVLIESIDAYREADQWKEFSVQAMESIASGTCGDNLEWYYYSNGTLEIIGSGAMTDFAALSSSGVHCPWQDYKKEITSIILPEGLTNIGTYSFSYCEKITSVRLPESVTKIGYWAFANCSLLSEINIPKSVTSIGTYAFNGCSALTSVDIPNSVITIGSEAFCFCRNITSLTIGKSVKEIGSNAFQDCSGITSLVLPASVSKIEHNAFSNCTGLTSITCRATNPPLVYYFNSDKKTGGVFNDVDKSIPLYVPEESIAAYQDAEQWKDFTNIQAIPNTTKTVYLVPDRWDKNEGDKFAVWAWTGDEAGKWSEFMTLTEDGRAYEAEISKEYTNLLFARFASSTEMPSWETDLDQTVDLIYNIDKPVFEITTSEYVYYTPRYSAVQHTWPFWYITFEDSDGTQLQKQLVDNEAIPSAPSTPKHEGYTFSGWDNEIVAATADATYKATYEIAEGYYALTVKANNDEWGSVSGSGVYSSGEKATLMAVGNDGYEFSKWSDGNTDNPRFIEITQDSTFTAIFKEIFVCDVVAGGTCGENLTWELCSNGTLVISGTGEMTDYTDTYEPTVNIWGATVTERVEVYAPWYEYRTQIKEVVIEDGVTSIGDEAFEDCTAMTTVTIPEGVTSIGYKAFAGCTAMTTVTIPSTLQDIKYSAFDNCSSLSIVYWNARSMSMPTHYFEFPQQPFREYDEIQAPVTTIIFGEEVERIPAYMCKDMTTLTSVTFSNSITVVEPFAFSGCTGLTEPIYNNKVFAYMPANYSGEYTIPDGIVSVAGGAFDGCSSITSVMLPESVTEVGYRAFFGCTGLTSPIYNATVFARCPSLIGDEYTIPDGTKVIGSSAFSAAPVTKVNIPNSVVEIGEEAFYNCQALTSPELPNEVVSIGTQAFYGCKNITDVVLGDSLKFIGDALFYGCTNLQSITFKTKTPPTLSETLPKYYIGEGEVSDWSSRLGNISCTIYVPCSSVAAYKEFLPTHVSQIVGTGGYTLTLLSVNEEMGTVWQEQNSSSCEGSAYSISATANDGYEFVRWSDGVTDSYREITLTTDSTITALFQSKSAAIALDVDAIEFDYYPSYNPANGFNYSLFIYKNDEDANDVPQVALDIYTTTHKEFAGEYSVAKGNIGITYSQLSLPANNDDGYEGFQITDAACVIAVDGDTYTVTGTVTAENGQVYSYSATAKPVYNDAEHMDEPETPQTLDITIKSGEIDMTKISEGLINLNFTTEDDGQITLVFKTANKEALTMPEGVFNFSNNTNETFLEGVYSNNAPIRSYAKMGNKVYYLTDGTVTVSSYAVGREITVDATSFYGTKINFMKLIWGGDEPQPVTSYTISVQVASGQETWGTVSGSGKYESGTEVTLSATPNDGYEFVKWNDGNTNSTRTIIALSDSVFTATFAEAAPPVGTRAIYLNTSPMYWYNDQKDYYIQAWQYEDYPTTIKMDCVADYLYRAYINEDYNKAYFFNLDKGETFTSIDDIWDGQKTKTTIPSDKDMYILTSGYMGVWTSEYGEWSKYDAAKSAENYVYGTTGEVEYAVRRDNTFIIYGSGAMEHYETYKGGEDPRYYWPQWNGWSYNITSISLSEGLTVIGAYSMTFPNVTTVTIPSTVSVIGSGAFNAKNYTSITCEAVTPPTIAARTTTEELQHFFKDVDFSIPLYVPAESVEAYKDAEYWRDFTNIHAIGGDPQPQEYVLTVQVNNTSYGYVTGGGTYKEGEVATVTATAYEGYEFVSWSDGNVNNPLTITMTADKTIKAYFQAKASIISVAEAISITMELPDSASTKDEYIVEGFVVNAERFNPIFKNQVFYLADDVDNTAGQFFKAYHCSVVENGDTVPVINGDKVHLRGQLTKYIEKDGSAKPEIGRGIATFVSKAEGERSEFIVPTITVAQALEYAAALEVGATGTTEYIVHGFVTYIRENTYNTDYKSMTFWMADEANGATSNEEGAFYVYRGKPNVELVEGDEVNVATKLKNYNGIYETETNVPVRKVEPKPEPKPEDERTVTLQVNNEAWGTVSGGGTFYKGDTITITATPYEGYIFVTWSNGDTNMTTQYVVGANVVITAQFAPEPQAEPIPLDMNSLEIDYYPTYNSEKGYNYALFIYYYEEGSSTYLPVVAFDIYTAVHKSFAGEYNTANGNVDPKYGIAQIPSTSTNGFDQYDLTDAACTITMNSDSSYTVVGSITISTGQVYTFEVTDVPYYCDAVHFNEPEEPQTLDISIISGEIDMQFINKGKIYINFVTADSGKVVLSFGTADSTALDIPDGTYTITYDTKETFWSGETVNNRPAFSYATIGEYWYYLNDGTVTIETVSKGRNIDVDVVSYYGTRFQFSYLIKAAAKTEYTIQVFANDTRLGSILGDGTYKEGEVATLIASAYTNCRFVRWSDGSTENPRDITVTANAAYMAIFTADASSSGTGSLYEYDEYSGVVNPWPGELKPSVDKQKDTEEENNAETPKPTSAQKIVLDGRLYILRDGNVYTATGAEVK